MTITTAVYPQLPQKDSRVPAVNRKMDAIATDMTFSQALDMIKKGHRLTRGSWPPGKKFLFLVPGSTFEVNRAPLLGIYEQGKTIQYHAHIDVQTEHGYVMPYVFSQDDILSSDWVMLS